MAALASAAASSAAASTATAVTVPPERFSGDGPAGDAAGSPNSKLASKGLTGDLGTPSAPSAPISSSSSTSSSSSRVVDSSTVAMVDGSSRETSSPAVVGAETVVEAETSTALTGDDGADDLPSTIATSALATRTASGVAGWSMASSLSEPAWCGPAGPGRSLPPSPSLVFFSGGVAVAGVTAASAGGDAGTVGETSRLLRLDPPRERLLWEEDARSGAGEGEGWSSFGAGGLARGAGGWLVGVAAGVSGGGSAASSFPALSSRVPPPGDARDPRDATAGLGQRSTASSARAGVVTSAAGGGARSESSGARTSGGGLAQAPAFLVVDTETTVWVTPPPPPLPGLDDSSSVSHASPGMAGVGRTGTARRCLLGVVARAASSEGNCRGSRSTSKRVGEPRSASSKAASSE